MLWYAGKEGRIPRVGEQKALEVLSSHIGRCCWTSLLPTLQSRGALKFIDECEICFWNLHKISPLSCLTYNSHLLCGKPFVWKTLVLMAQGLTQ